MLSMMREHATSWIIKIILGVIVLVFVFSFGFSSFQSKGDRVVTVNGDTISRSTYEQSYKRTLEFYRQQFGKDIDSQLLASLNLRQNVLDQLVDDVLILQHASDLGMQVTQQELIQDIVQTPAFQNQSGQFDKARFQQILGRMGTSDKEYEKEKQRAMLSSKIRSFISALAQISDQEARQWYNWNGKEVSIKYAVFEPASYIDVAVTDEEILAYYEANNQDYETQPMVKISYLYFNPDDFVESQKAPQEEIESYYDENMDTYFEDTAVHARHILITLDKEATPEQVEKALTKAREVEAKAKAGEDFAELAKEFSDGPTAPKGGDLGFFTRNRMVKPFEDAAFALQAGEISEPVRTDFGWHIIKVEEIREARTKELAEVAESIRTKIAKEMALDAAYSTAEKAFDNLLAEMDMTKAAEASGVELKTTGFFTKQGPKDLLPSATPLAEEVFDMHKDSFSDILQYDEGFYVVWILDKKPAIIPELEEVRARVEADVKEVAKLRTAKEKAAEFLVAVKGGENMEEAATRFNVTVKNTGFFKRGGYIPDMGNEPAVVAAAFMADTQHPYPEAPVEGVKGVFITCSTDEKYPSPEGFEDKKEEIKQQLLMGKRGRILEEALTALRERGEVKQFIPVS
ncbi:MAG: SurA N-terminal domain-containing protein [Desulfatibacillum sp.]|nr:SurA N-terminal domain-containing protein [Desulfatibacillum sp.]